MDSSAFLESWDRQAQIMESLCGLISDELKLAKPSDDGMPLFEQIAHVHQCRKSWLSVASPEHSAQLENVYVPQGDTWVPIDDFAKIKEQFRLSSAAVREATQSALEQNIAPMGPYDHPVFFLQHMLWHEGYHAGLILLALRLAGQDPGDAWEEKHIWELWRGPE